MVMIACQLLASATLSQGVMVSRRQTLVAQRLWVLQSLAAAEASIRLTQAQIQQLPSLPAQGCEQGRCAWSGATGLSRQHWVDQNNASGPCGALAGPATPLSQWPTLPGAILSCWMEATPAPEGHWLRLTARVHLPSSKASTVMQSVWHMPANGAMGRWVSWREVLP